MSSPSGKHKDLKKRLTHEMESYVVISVYLGVFLLSFAFYRRLLMEEYDLGYFQVGWVVMEALILGKIVLIGEALHVGEKLQDRRLFLSVLWKTFTFSLLVLAFKVLEHVAGALLHHKPVAEVFDLSGGRGIEILSRVELMAVAFVPFFAFRELGRVLGEGKLVEIFFRKPSGRSPGKVG
jgi:hypothetical protein